MAYGTNQQRSSYGNSNSNNSKAAASAGAKSSGQKREVIFRTGLFAPTKEGVKAIGTVQVKEDVTIPAGSYLNLYESDKKSEKSPAFSLSVTPGQMKK
jgi:hypothetical protein